MKQPIIIIGIGEIAGVLARAFLRGGHPVYPITRDMDISVEAQQLPDPLMVVVAVAERDYPVTMASLPEHWCGRLVLLQNELLPHDWEMYDVQNPTIISVWFEKKKGMDYNPVLPSPVYGPNAELIAGSLEKIGVPCRVLKDAQDLLVELVLKNVFVFTINIAGLVLADGTTTSVLWEEHRELASHVANDIIDLQQAITGKTLIKDKILEGMVAGFRGDPNHKCKGRSAEGRLLRTLKVADEKKLEVPAIRDIHQRLRKVPDNG